MVNPALILVPRDRPLFCVLRGGRDFSAKKVASVRLACARSFYFRSVVSSVHSSHLGSNSASQRTATPPAELGRWASQKATALSHRFILEIL